MKTYKSVVATRLAYHKDGTLNSVHRSSLLVPELPAAQAEIAFANHFLLKRRIPKVGCRITGIAADGKRVESRLVEVTEPRVYRLRPAELIKSGTAAAYLVEFFAADNLYYPFPAVMVNHLGAGFLNTVHAYNRVLNDAFEDDDINATDVWESAIDVALDARTDTQVHIAAGQVPCVGPVEIELIAGGRAHCARTKVHVPRFGHAPISVGALFPDVPRPVDGFLRLRQPHQGMFFGRAFAGRWCADGAFAANHSYYDSSTVEEYWDNTRPHVRTYPWFPHVEAGLRIYPIMSPGRIRFFVTFQDAAGQRIAAAELGELASPSHAFLAVWLGEVLERQGVSPDAPASFTLHGQSLEKDTPTRITHQVLYRDPAQRGLAASVNVSLADPNTPVAAGRTGLTWCQAILGNELRTFVGIQHLRPTGDSDDIEVTFYDERGELARRRWPLAAGAAVVIDLARELAPELAGRCGTEARPIWLFASAHRPDLSTFAVTAHQHTGHCAAEHGF